MVVSKSDIEKTIYRIIMATWHTAKHKRTNARDVSILAADMIWHQTMDKSGEIKQALEYGANYRFGDGDVTAMFDRALNAFMGEVKAQPLHSSAPCDKGDNLAFPAMEKQLVNQCTSTTIQ